MLKNKKGLSLTTLVITLVILLLIVGALTYSAVDSVKIRKLNKFYNDLRQLSDSIEIYFLKNGKLPVEEIYYSAGVDSEINFTLISPSLGATRENMYNPNDYSGSTRSAIYQVIKLDLLDNLSLNNPGNTYIININSHTIYNLTGIVIDGKEYHNIPLDYKDMKLYEIYPVRSIGLKAIEGITDGETGGNNIFYAYSAESLNLKDLLTFGSNEVLSTEEVDDLADPKTIQFKISDTNCFDVNENTGILTKKIGLNEATDIGSSPVTLTVRVTNYDESVKSKEFNIYTSALAVRNAEGTENLKKINIAAGQTSEEYSLKRYGYLYTQNDSGIEATSLAPNIGIAMYNYNSGNDRVTFKGVGFGSTKIHFKSQNYGFAEDTVTLNVFDFEVYKGSAGSSTNIDKLNFSGVGEKEATNILLNIKGPDNFELYDGTNYSENRVNWSIVSRDPNNENAYIEDTTSQRIKITTYENEHNYVKATITPLKTGITYLKYTVQVDSKIIKEGIIPVYVLGGITATNLTDTDHISLIGENKSVTLTYALDSSVTTGASSVRYRFSSSNIEFSVDETSNETGVFVVSYIGTSSAATSEDIEITAEVTKDGVTTSYSDVVTVVYTRT